MVLFLLVSPLPGTATQFSLRVQLHSFYEAQLEIFFFHKIPATSWILSCLFLLRTPDGCVACTSQASPTQSRYFIKKISFTSEWMKKIFGRWSDWPGKKFREHTFQRDPALNIYSIIQLIFHWVPAMSGPVLSSSDTRQIWVPTFKDCRGRRE